MQLRKKWYISYNPYFLFPCLAWAIAGAILLTCYSAKDLFYAINSRHTEFADVIMDKITWLGEGLVITAILISLFAFARFRNWWYFFTALLCNIIPFFAEQGLKSYYDSPRPVNYFHHAAWIHRAANWPELLYRGYPSGHSEGATCFLCFLSLLLPVRYRAFGFLFFLLALTVCYSRVYLAAHFFEDVYAGSILGTVMCVLIYSAMDFLGNRLFSKKERFI